MPASGTAAQDSEQPASLSLELLQGCTLSVAAAAAQDWDRPVSCSLCSVVLFTVNIETVVATQEGNWATCYQLLVGASIMIPSCWQHRRGASRCFSECALPAALAGRDALHAELCSATPASLLTVALVCAGKTSFIAAVANLMRYSIYDLDLTSVSSNLDLRALLTQVIIETASLSGASWQAGIARVPRWDSFTCLPLAALLRLSLHRWDSPFQAVVPLETFKSSVME